MQIAIESKLKQGALFELVQKYGSQKAVAERMGISQQEFGKWLAFKRLPSAADLRQAWAPARLHRVEAVLAEVGAILDDVFPAQRIQLSTGARRKVWRGEVPEADLVQLEACTAQSYLPDYSGIETEEFVAQCLERMTRREERLIRKRFGLQDGREYTIEEIAQDEEVSRSRVDQIVRKALAKCQKAFTPDGERRHPKPPIKQAPCPAQP